MILKLIGQCFIGHTVVVFNIQFTF
jgi:hypothetical protein